MYRSILPHCLLGLMVFSWGCRETTEETGILGANERPEVQDLIIATDEDTPVAIRLVGTDADGDLLTYLVLEEPVNGSLSGTPPDLSYLPAPNFAGEDKLVYRASDGSNSGLPTDDDRAFGESLDGQVLITVRPVNDTPTAEDVMAETEEQTPVDIALVASDVEDMELSYEVSTYPTYGEVSASAKDASVMTYVPEDDFVGDDSFTYYVRDSGDARSNTATVMVSVTGVNDPPVGAADQYFIDEDEALFREASVGLLANDSNIEFDTLEVTGWTDPVVMVDVDGDGVKETEDPLADAFLVFDVDTDGSFSYTPPAHFYGQVSFTYTLSDGGLESDVPIDVTIYIEPVPDSPVILEDPSYQVLEDAIGGLVVLAEMGEDGLIDAAVCAAGGDLRSLLCFVEDADPGQPVKIAEIEEYPSHGALTSWGEDGSFTYEPDLNFEGWDDFTVRVEDEGFLDGGTMTVNIDVVATNDAPVPVGDSYSVEEDGELVVGSEDGFLSNDSDIDMGDVLTTVPGIEQETTLGVVSWDENGAFVYTPNPNLNGTDSFQYVLRDGIEEVGPVTVTINVLPANDAPQPGDDGVYAATEDEDLEVEASCPGDGSPGGLLCNDSEIDEGDTLDAYLSREPTLEDGSIAGVVVVSEDGSFVFDPYDDVNGIVTFAYESSDGEDRVEAEVTIDIAPVNDAPVAVGETYVTEEQTLLEIASTCMPEPAGLLCNDSDVDEGAVITAMLRSGVSRGDLNFAGDGSGAFTYMPEPEFNGTDSFTYRLTDSTSEGTALSDDVTVFIEVGPINDPPVANDDEYTTNEDEILVISSDAGALLTGVLSNDSDEDHALGDLTAILDDQVDPAYGTVVLAGDGSFTFTPMPNQNNDTQGGPATFTYHVQDLAGAVSDEATVTIGVDPVNDAPTAAGDGPFAVDEDADLEYDSVLDNDSDIDGDELEAVVVDGGDAEHGTLILDPDGSFFYVPDPDYYGPDSFTYVAEDPGRDGSGPLQSEPVEVLIDVIQVLDHPVANPDAYSVDEDVTLSVDGTEWESLLANDTDADPDDILAAVVAEAPSNGSLTLTSNGFFTYVPYANFNGTDTFTYWAFDGALYSGGGSEFGATTVTIIVNAVNDAPHAADDTYTALEEETMVIVAEEGLLANDDDLIDEVDAALFVLEVGAPSSGTLTSWGEDGSFTYVPDTDFNGDVTFTYTMADMDGRTPVDPDPTSVDTATVTLTFEPVNDDPVGGVDVYFTNEETTLNVSTTPSGLLSNDTDVDGDDLYVVVTVDPLSGSLSWNATGAFAYTPDLDFVGWDEFTYEAIDTSGASSGPVLAMIEVGDLNDDPTVVEDFYTVEEDFPGGLDVDAEEGLLANDYDVDEGDPMSAFVLTDPDHGEVSIETDGSFVYTPDPDYFGTDSFEYVVVDDSDGLGTGWVFVEVTPVNDAPVAVEENYETSEDTPLTTTVVNGLLANDVDVDGDDLMVTMASGPSNGLLFYDFENGTFTYEPNEDFNGTDSFTYRAYDDGGLYSDPTDVEITVHPVDDVPVVSDDSYSMDEDFPGGLVVLVDEGVLENDTEIDEELMTSELRSSPAHGELTAFNPDGSFTYVPDPDFNGTDSFTYEAMAVGAASEPGTVTITVNPINDKAVPAADYYSTSEDTPITILTPGLLSNDVDIDTDFGELRVHFDAYGTDGEPWVTTGTVEFTPDGLGGFTYTPEDDFNGVEVFTYTVHDGVEMSDPATVTLTVGADNDAPTTVADEYETDEDTFLPVDASEGVLSNDMDTDGDALTVGLVEAPNPLHGTVLLAAPGGFNFTPAENYFGEATFTYEAFDGVDLSVVTTVTVTINPINDAPVANEDSYSTPEDVDLDVGVDSGVLVNDSDVESDVTTLTAVLVEDSMDVSEGTVVLSADGSFLYAPAAEFTGVATFAYYIEDDDQVSESQTVTITVVGGNDAPDAGADAYSVDEDESLNILEAAGLLSNDIDVDGDALTVTLDGDWPEHGFLVLQEDGAFSYEPDPDFNGTDSFMYTVDDGELATSGVMVTITVNPINDAPVAVDDLFNMAEDTSVSFDALANDSDVDGDPFVLVEDGGEVSVELGPGFEGSLVWDTGFDGAFTGTFTYEPEPDFAGEVSFRYTLTDGELVSDPATVTIDVINTNDPPVVVDEDYTVTEDVTLGVAALEGVLVNDSDSDADALIATIGATPDHGSVLLNTNGSFTYTPDPDYDGTVDGADEGDTFTYWVSDGVSADVLGTVTLDFEAINDPPEANWADGSGDAITTVEDTLQQCVGGGGCLFSNDRDIDSPNEDLTTTLVSDAVHGTATVGEDGLGTYSYMPDENYTGDDAFSYQLCDPEFCTDPVVVSVTVTEANDPPVGVVDVYTVNEDELLIVDTDPTTPDVVLANDSDIDGDLPLRAALDTNVIAEEGELLSFADDGSFEFMPAADFEGAVTFKYMVFDALNTVPEPEVPINVTINVVGVEDPPEAVDDHYTVSEDDVLDLDRYEGFLANDLDAEDGVLSVVSIDVGPNLGVLDHEVDGAFVYTPNPDEDGDSLETTVDDSFTYTVTDGTFVATGVVSISITPINDPPVAEDDIYTLDEDTDLVVDGANGLVSNDDDVEGDPMTVVLVEGSGPNSGELTLFDDGSFLYSPVANYNTTLNESVSFQYEVWDEYEQGTTGTVTLEILPVQDLPTAESASITTPEGEAKACEAATETCFVTEDVDGEVLTFSVVVGADNGLVEMSDDGSYTYTPVDHYYGLDSFMYQVDDGAGGVVQAEVAVEVTYVADAPRADSVAISIPDGDGYDVGTPWTCTADATAFDDEGTLTFDFIWTLDSGPEYTQSASVTTTEGAEIGDHPDSGLVHESLATASVTMTPASDFTSMKKGDSVTCSVVVHNGASGPESDLLASGSQTVENAVPSLYDVEVTSSPGSANVDSTLTCIATAGDLDVDDTLSYTYTWTLVDSGELTTETTGSDTSELVLASYTGDGVARDQTVECEVTVTDGGDTTDPLSDQVTLGNAPPTATIVSFDDALGGRPTVESTLRCEVSGDDSDGDDITYNYTVTPGAGGLPSPAASGYVSDTSWDFDISALAPAYASGDVFTCTVTPKDSMGATGPDAVSDPLVLDNALPVVTGVTVVDTLGHEANAGSTLECLATVSDADDDAVDISYAWGWDDAGVTFGDDASTVALLDFAYIAEGDTIYCTATPYDHEGIVDDTVSAVGSVDLVNDVPEVTSVAITPADPLVTDTVTCAGTVLDADLVGYGGTDTVDVQVTWYVDALLPEVVTPDVSADSNGVFTTSVDVASLPCVASGCDQPSVGSSLTCTARPVDSDGDLGELVMSDPVVVANSLPVVTEVSLAPEAGGDTYINSMMLCTVTASSDDDTADSIRYDFDWYVGVLGEEVNVHTDTSSGYGDPTGSFDLTIAGLGTSNFGHNVYCTATPIDDHGGSGDAVASNGVELVNQPPVIDMSLTYTDAGPAGFDVGDEVTCSGTVEDLDENGAIYTLSWYLSSDDVYDGSDALAGSTTPASYDATGAFEASNTASVLGADSESLPYIFCVVSATDDSGSLTEGEEFLEVGNAPPMVESVVITGDPDPITKDSSLTCTGMVSDVDTDDIVNVTFTWSVNAVDSGLEEIVVGVASGGVSGSQDSTAVLVTDLGAQSGDQITCQVTAESSGAESTGEDTVEVGNHVPVVTAVDFSGGPPEAPEAFNLHTEQVTCSGTVQELDGDTVAVRTYMLIELAPDEPELAVFLDTVEIAPATGDFTVTQYLGGSYCDSEEGEDDPEDCLSPDTHEFILPDGYKTVDDVILAKGQQIRCSAEPVEATAEQADAEYEAEADDYVHGDVAYSDYDEIVNATPILMAEISPEDPSNNATMTCSVSVFDEDGDGGNLSVVVTVGDAVVTPSPASPFNYAVEAAGDETEEEAEVTFTLDPITVENGDTVTCDWTMDDGDGGVETATAQTDVGNSMPSILDVVITPAEGPLVEQLTECAVTVSDVDAGDSLDVTITWFGDGEALFVDSQVAPESGEVSSTVTPTGLGLVKGEDLYCLVGVSDGLAVDTAMSDVLTVQDSTPVLLGVDLTPVDPTISDTVTCSLSSYEADMDTACARFELEWGHDATTEILAMSTSEMGPAVMATSSSFDLSTEAMARGDTLTCRADVVQGECGDLDPSETSPAAAVSALVSATMDSPTRTVANSAPTVSAAWSNELPNRYDVITCTASPFDIDGDALDYTIDIYAGGSLENTVSGTWTAGDPDPTASFDLINTSRDTAVECVVEVTDTMGDDGTDEATVFVQDTGPVMLGVTLTPASPSRADMVTCIAEVDDIDGDDLCVRLDLEGSGTVSEWLTGTAGTVEWEVLLEDHSVATFSKGDTLTCYADVVSVGCVTATGSAIGEDIGFLYSGLGSDSTVIANAVPVAVDDDFVTNEEVPVVLDFLANDEDADLDGLSVVSTSSPSMGDLVDMGDSGWVYTPWTDEVGTDSFTYTITDGTATSNTATVVIDVGLINDPPVFGDDVYDWVYGATRSFNGSAGLLANDSDVDSDLSVEVGSVTSSEGRAVELYADGSFDYHSENVLADDSDGDGTLEDTFEYTVFEDGGGVDDEPHVRTATIQLHGPFIWFVDNEESGSDGHEADPFGTLLEAEVASSDGEIIYVLTGDGTDLGQDESIALKPGQWLAGPGAEMEVEGIMVKPHSDSAIRPVISARASDAASPIVILPVEQSYAEIKVSGVALEAGWAGISQVGDWSPTTIEDGTSELVGSLVVEGVDISEVMFGINAGGSGQVSVLATSLSGERAHANVSEVYAPNEVTDAWFGLSLWSDANCDGEADAVEDDFVEITNTMYNPMDLEGHKILVDGSTWHTFEAGDVLGGGQSAVVFGGGVLADIEEGYALEEFEQFGFPDPGRAYWAGSDLDWAGYEYTNFGQQGSFIEFDLTGTGIIQLSELSVELDIDSRGEDYASGYASDDCPDSWIYVDVIVFSEDEGASIDGTTGRWTNGVDLGHVYFQTPGAGEDSINYDGISNPLVSGTFYPTNASVHGRPLGSSTGDWTIRYELATSCGADDYAHWFDSRYAGGVVLKGSDQHPIADGLMASDLNNNHCFEGTTFSRHVASSGGDLGDMNTTVELARPDGSVMNSLVAYPEDYTVYEDDTGDGYYYEDDGDATISTQVLISESGGAMCGFSDGFQASWSRLYGEYPEGNDAYDDVGSCGQRWLYNKGNYINPGDDEGRYDWYQRTGNGVSVGTTYDSSCGRTLEVINVATERFAGVGTYIYDYAICDAVDIDSCQLTSDSIAMATYSNEGADYGRGSALAHISSSDVSVYKVNVDGFTTNSNLIDIGAWTGVGREFPRRVELGGVSFGRIATNERTDGTAAYAIGLMGDAMLMDLVVEDSSSTNGVAWLYNFNWSGASDTESTLRAGFYDNDFAGGWAVYNEGHLDWVGTGSDLTSHLGATDNTSGGAAPVIVSEDLTAGPGTFDSLAYGAIVADWPAETCDAHHVGGTQNTHSSIDYTGNAYQVEQDVTLQAFAQHMVLVDPCDLVFYVHTSTSSLGPWDPVATVTVAGAPDGDQYYDSGLLDIDLVAGEFVSMGVVGDCSSTSYWEDWNFVQPENTLSGADLGGYMTNIGYTYSFGWGAPSVAIYSNTLNFEQMVFLTPDE